MYVYMFRGVDTGTQTRACFVFVGVWCVYTDTCVLHIDICVGCSMYACEYVGGGVLYAHA